MATFSEFADSSRSISDLLRSEGIDNDTEYSIEGWVEYTRFQKRVGFVEIMDGKGPIPLQLVFPYTTEEKETYSDKLTCVRRGAAISIIGKIVGRTPTERDQRSYEINCSLSDLIVYGSIDPTEYPLSKPDQSLEYLRTVPHLRIRTRMAQAVARIRSTCSFATHQFFRERRFQWVATPLITENDCEGAGETFTVTTMMSGKRSDIPVTTQIDEETGETVETDIIDHTKDFFGKRTSLTVSGQLHGETHAIGLSDIYTFGPTFRSENSHTSRHLAEFWMIEPEWCFHSFEELMQLGQDYVCFCIQQVLEQHHDDLEYLEQIGSGSGSESGLIEMLSMISNSDFERLTYTDAIALLQQDFSDTECITEYDEIDWGDDMSSFHEKYIVMKIGKPVIVTHYPAELKSFYMKKDEDCPEDRQTVQAMDILVPGIGELIGGSQREDNYEKLIESTEAKGIDIEPIQWYLDLRKYSTVPHGGFGLGFERLILLVTGVQNIRDVIPFPRTPGTCIH